MTPSRSRNTARFTEHSSFDYFAENVSRQDMGFLNARCVLRRNAQAEIGRVAQSFTRFASHRNGDHAPAPGGLESSKNIARTSTCGYPKRSITRNAQRFDLPGEYLIKRIVVADRG